MHDALYNFLKNKMYKNYTISLNPVSSIGLKCNYFYHIYYNIILFKNSMKKIVKPNTSSKICYI